MSAIHKLKIAFRDTKAKAALCAAAAAAVAFLAYSPAFDVPLLSDDWHLAWIAAHSTQPWFAYFWTNYAGTAVGYAYRPLQIVYFLVANGLGGTDPLVYHLIQIGFHAANTILVFVLARKLAGGKSLFLPTVASSLFALFPNHSEAVVWPSAIGDPTATFFMLVTVLAWIVGRKRRSLTFYALSWVACVFALASKDMAMSLPFIVAAWELLNLHQTGLVRQVMKSACRVLPFFAILAAYFTIRLDATGYLFGYYGAPKVAFDPMVMVRTYLAIPVSHFVSGLTRTEVMDFLYRVVDTRVTAATIAIVIAVIIFAARAGRKFWWLAVAFVVSIAPVAQLGLNHLPGRVSDEGERYAYLPSVFLAIMLASAIDAIRRRGKKLGTIVAVMSVAVLLITMTLQLESKLGDWNAAGALATKALTSWPDAYSTATTGKMFVVGLPDNYRGVPLWRNSLAEAHELVFGTKPDVTVTALRTVIDRPHGFIVSDLGDDRWSYVSRLSDSPRADIVGLLSVAENGYSAKLGERTFSIYALTYRDFSDSAELSLRPWVDANPSSPTTAVFWKGEGWISRSVGAND